MDCHGINMARVLIGKGFKPSSSSHLGSYVMAYINLYIGHSVIVFYYIIYCHYRTQPALSISGLKYRAWNWHFLLKKYGKKWSRIFYFEIHRAPAEIPANLPGQFSLYGQIVLHWAAATLKNFKIKKLDHF